MIRITRKADYAVFIMSYLARRAHHGGAAGDGPVSAQELASFSALNKSLVANLLKDLARARLLTSVRGARGGYQLVGAPAGISLGQIVRAVEGPFALVECVDAEPPAGAPANAAISTIPCGCSLSSLCTSKGPLQVLHDRIQRLVDDLKLSELSGLDTSPANAPPPRAPAVAGLGPGGAPAPAGPSTTEASR